MGQREGFDRDSLFLVRHFCSENFRVVCDSVGAGCVRLGGVRLRRRGWCATRWALALQGLAEDCGGGLDSQVLACLLVGWGVAVDEVLGLDHVKALGREGEANFEGLGDA